MQLDERKMKILQAIINNYLETGEPVGSRTISKFTDLNLSSATIRNEMSDLEDLGFIMQPHTSAGRVPSDKGYRLYVDKLMNTTDMQNDLFKEFIFQKVDRIEAMLQEIARLLAIQTNYATVVSAPMYNRNKLKHIELILIEPQKVIAVIVVEGDFVKNQVITMDQPMDVETVAMINATLNESLFNLTLVDINLGLIQSMKEKCGEYSSVINPVLDAIAEAIQSAENVEIYTSGTTNILKCPEFSDIEKAADIIYTLEEKQVLQGLMNSTMTEEDNSNIHIYIGNETSVKSMENCSVITANYQLAKGLVGTIGIIGPKRMNYEKVVSVLRILMRQMDGLLNIKT